MAKVGTINDNGNGAVRTLKLDLKFKLERIGTSKGGNEPTHRVTSNGVELGAAWTKHRDGGGDFLSLTIDDPSFETPLNLAAFPVEGLPGIYDVVWNRPRQQKQDAA